ncbi:hypothetical protein LTR10_018572 [Elasticomyces elasticus]|uniref:laccase n=1 Tax=Exophiala sideris TaxID=1016849 RepID=A0ABR0JP08_9EURO|nr:hypothetical protein LTR10_018572 [Elasticomyces elasticus]KAK5038053.1 hypothetical protein LTS07_001521 [Exophiala sideris]KAK5044035.1 hypothetical protein LTR13_000391 [Exophiala sideris]KAK5067534.1 hypothetical protein LTR69_001523 [Exophiala sideris]KAK5184227.1 hypothetical protein LTR44_003733 [Eurotiomycetes sp. CCFEE 6388]
MRSVPLFLTAAAVGLAGATWTEADVTVTVTATSTHTVCAATTTTTIETCEAPGSSTIGSWSAYSTSSSAPDGASSWSAYPTSSSGPDGASSWSAYPTSSEGPDGASSWSVYSTSSSASAGGHSTWSSGPDGASTTTSIPAAVITSAENAWASQWDAQKTNYVGPWNDWSVSGSGAGKPTKGGSSSSSSTSSSSTGYTTSAPYGGWNASTTSGSASTSASSTSTTTSSSGCPTYTPEKNASDICNSASDRSVWCDNLDIDTNSYTTQHKTGITRSYTLVIENTTMSFDGTAPKVAFTINGQIPGPVIEANWGDYVSVTVINKLQDNATSIHFHGIRQESTNDMDGVPGVTECAIAGNGGSKTYTWLASSYGTSWYHSHAFAQYGDGVRGPIVIHGPATADYDIDMGTVMIDDTFANAVGTQADLITHYGPGGSFNTLFNGKNINPVGPGGEAFQWTVQPCRKHRFRIINSSSQNLYVVGFDAHNMTVIAADFVPIKPYDTPTLNIAIGQRYDVIVETNQPVGSYYVRAVIQTGCPSGGANSGLGTANAIMNYAGSNSTPVTNTPITNITAAGCIDEPLASLVPWVALSAGDSGKFTSSVDTIPAGLVTQVQTSDDGLVFQWYINNGVIAVNYSTPTIGLLDSAQGANNSAISNAVVLNEANTWVYFVIQNQFFASHPMHVHGHDVSVLGTGTQTWDSSLTSTLNFENPMRRDTVVLQGSAGPGNPAGYTVIGFETDNPGAWLMHCHIVWHVDDGLALQFIERPNDIVSQKYTSKDSYKQECAALNEYQSANPQAVRQQGESGLKRRTTYEHLGTSRNHYSGLKRHASHSHKRYTPRR